VVLFAALSLTLEVAIAKDVFVDTQTMLLAYRLFSFLLPAVVRNVEPFAIIHLFFKHVGYRTAPLLCLTVIPYLTVK
jgi:hypothetical protein